MNRTEIGKGAEALSYVEPLFLPSGEPDREALDALADRIRERAETDPTATIGTPLAEILSLEPGA